MTTITLNQNNCALRAAEQAVAEETFTRVILCMRDHPCVSFALSCCGHVHWSPEMDVAVRLMLHFTDGGPIPAGQVIVDANPRWVTPERLEAGEKALADCIALLKKCGRPFTLLAHINGHREIEYHYIRDGQEFPLATIADAVAAEVRYFGRG